MIKLHRKLDHPSHEVRELWRDTVVASIHAGYDTGTAKEKADKTVMAYRERLGLDPETGVDRGEA